MSMTLEERFTSAQRRADTAQKLTARGISTSKLQLAFDALDFADGNVSQAKSIIAQREIKISASTWNKAIQARILCSPVPVL